MKPTLTSIDEMVRDCLAVRVRMIGRAVSALYDHAVETHGVTIAQVNLLAAIGKIGRCSPKTLGDVLQLERSTVSRNLDLLFKSQWIVAISTDGKGVRELELTPAGLAKIDSIMTDWRAAQNKAAQLLGETGVQAVRHVAGKIKNF